jgi:hypothetical protein
VVHRLTSDNDQAGERFCSPAKQVQDYGAGTIDERLQRIVSSHDQAGEHSCSSAKQQQENLARVLREILERRQDEERLEKQRNPESSKRQSEWSRSAVSNRIYYAYLETYDEDRYSDAKLVRTLLKGELPLNPRLIRCLIIALKASSVERAIIQAAAGFEDAVYAYIGRHVCAQIGVGVSLDFKQCFNNNLTIDEHMEFLQSVKEALWLALGFTNQLPQ